MKITAKKKPFGRAKLFSTTISDGLHMAHTATAPTIPGNKGETTRISIFGLAQKPFGKHKIIKWKECHMQQLQGAGLVPIPAKRPIRQSL